MNKKRWKRFFWQDGDFELETDHKDEVKIHETLAKKKRDKAKKGKKHDKPA